MSFLCKYLPSKFCGYVLPTSQYDSYFWKNVYESPGWISLGAVYHCIAFVFTYFQIIAIHNKNTPFQYKSLRYTTTLYIALYCNKNTLHITALHFTTLHLAALQFIALHYTTLQYSSLQFTTLHLTALHFTLIHYT